jgi:hypothetical protein
VQPDKYVGLKGFWWEYVRERDPLGDWRRWEDNIKSGVQDLGTGLSGFIWLKMGASDGLLVTR